MPAEMNHDQPTWQQADATTSATPRPALAVELGPRLHLQNPVLTASGTFGYGEEFARLYDLRQLGAVVVKGTTRNPRQGNPAPRLVETPAGILNSIGLQNPGIDAVLEEKLPFLAERQVPIIVNVAGDSPDDYQYVCSRLEGAAGVVAVELNISCPNVEHGGMTIGVDPCLAQETVRAARSGTTLPLIVKLTPNVTDIGEMAVAVVDAGADALSLVNTYVGMVIDVERRHPVLAHGSGGLSGPAIRPLAVWAVWQVYEALGGDPDRGTQPRVPLIGIGGIMSARDALEFILAGASAVQVGTANFVEPLTPLRVLAGIEEYCVRHGVAAVKELVGQAHRR